MQNIIVLKFLKLFLKIFVLFGLCFQIAYLFLAVRDLPFMLSFSNFIAQNKKSSDYAPHFEYYIRGDRHSPFLVMQERYLDLTRSTIMDFKRHTQGENFQYILDDTIKYYKSMFRNTPQNGHIAFLIAEAYFLKSDYISSADYLMQSYHLYPVSGRLAQARHKLSFRILPYLPKSSVPYREQDFKIMQLLKNRGQ